MMKRYLFFKSQLIRGRTSEEKNKMARERKTITKEWLQALGVSDVTEDGKVTYKGKVLKEYKATCKHKHGKDKTYPVVSVYDPELYKDQKAKGKDCPGIRLLLLSRVVYAWFNEVCPSEYDVDHIDNNPFNNNISNLQLLTRKENLDKHLSRNNHTCHLTDEQLKYFNEQKMSYEHMISEARQSIEEEKDEINKIQRDLDYYTEICKNIKDYKLYKEVKEYYRDRMSEHKEALKRHREYWHYWCKAYKDFKTSYLTREKSVNE